MISFRLRILGQTLPFLLIAPLALAQTPASKAPSRAQATAALNQPANPGAAHYTRQQIDQRGFAGARRADDRDDLAALHFEIDVAQDRLGRLVLERHAAEFDALAELGGRLAGAVPAELRHLNMQDALLRHQVFELRDAIASKGYEPEKIQFMQQRFGSLPAESTRLLRQQSEQNLQFQAEATMLEQQRTMLQQQREILDLLQKRGITMPGADTGA